MKERKHYCICKANMIKYLYMENYSTTTPEHENSHDEEIFNVEAMANRDIIELGRALSVAADAAVDRDDTDEAARIDGLWHSLQGGVEKLPGRDLDRARELLAIQMGAGNGHDYEAVATWIAGMHDYDYELTRDTLIRLELDEGLPGEGRQEFAGSTMRQLFETRLTPEQVADYNRCVQAMRNKLYG